jgi:hypothetical protein
MLQAYAAESYGRYLWKQLATRMSRLPPPASELPTPRLGLFAKRHNRARYLHGRASQQHLLNALARLTRPTLPYQTRRKVLGLERLCYLPELI